MRQPTHWLDLFSWKTWREFLDAGANVSGFRETQWGQVQRMRPGDFLLCYLTGVSRFIGLLEVASKGFRDTSPIWADEDFPCRVRVRPLIRLELEHAVPVQQLRDRLSAFQGDNPRAWTGRFRGSPRKWTREDGEVVVEALREAERNPINRPVDRARLESRPRGAPAPTGEVVSVPELEAPDAQPGPGEIPRQHTEIQFLLLKLGAEMGFEVWVARNDRSADYQGRRLGDMPRIRTSLPVQFDPVTSQTIQLIDVLWLEGRTIRAAFEVESTTNVYSGLLRMADLLAMQPNLNIPLYIVAPDERRETVLTQVNRPTFARLVPPLSSVCRLVPFSVLRRKMEELGDIVRYLRPDFLDEISETLELEGA